MELEDSDGRWMDKWYPGKGDTLTLKMGYKGETLLSCGTFSIDEIEVSAPPLCCVRQGVATSVNQALRTKVQPGVLKTLHWRPLPDVLPKTSADAVGDNRKHQN